MVGIIKLLSLIFNIDDNKDCSLGRSNCSSILLTVSLVAFLCYVFSVYNFQEFH